MIKAEDLPAHIRDQIATSWRAPVSSKNRHKYRAREGWEDNQRFDSQLELKCYQHLKLLKFAGVIKYFTRRPVFYLPGGIKHVVDFMVVVENREPIFGDAKGCDLPIGRLKRKQVLELYGVKIHVWSTPESIAERLS